VQLDKTIEDKRRISFEKLRNLRLINNAFLKEFSGYIHLFKSEAISKNSKYDVFLEFFEKIKLNFLPKRYLILKNESDDLMSSSYKALIQQKPKTWDF